MSTAPAVPKLAFTIEEACQALTISRPTLYELIATGRIHTVMAGRRRLVPLTELERLLAVDDTETTARPSPGRRAGPASIDYWLARLDPERFADASDDQKRQAADSARKAHAAELAMRSAKVRSKKRAG